jgi:hypothetical protein
LGQISQTQGAFDEVNLAKNIAPDDGARGGKCSRDSLAANCEETTPRSQHKNFAPGRVFTPQLDSEQQQAFAKLTNAVKLTHSL